jgi:hypothetical protein
MQLVHVLLEVEQVAHGVVQLKQLVPDVYVPSGHEAGQVLLKRKLPEVQVRHVVWSPVQVAHG